MVGVIVDPSVVSCIKPVELTMLDDRLDALFPEILLEFVPVKTLVGGHRLQVIEGSGQDLPSDLGVMWQDHLAVNVGIARSDNGPVG